MTATRNPIHDFLAKAWMYVKMTAEAQLTELKGKGKGEGIPAWTGTVTTTDSSYTSADLKSTSTELIGSCHDAPSHLSILSDRFAESALSRNKNVNQGSCSNYDSDTDTRLSDSDTTDEYGNTTDDYEYDRTSWTSSDMRDNGSNCHKQTWMDETEDQYVLETEINCDNYSEVENCDDDDYDDADDENTHHGNDPDDTDDDDIMRWSVSSVDDDQNSTDRHQPMLAVSSNAVSEPSNHGRTSQQPPPHFNQQDSSEPYSETSLINFGTDLVKAFFTTPPTSPRWVRLPRGRSFAEVERVAQRWKCSLEDAIELMEDVEIANHSLYTEDSRQNVLVGGDYV